MSPARLRKYTAPHVATTALLALLLFILLGLPFVVIVGAWYSITFAISYPFYRMRGIKLRFLDILPSIQKQ